MMKLKNKSAKQKSKKDKMVLNTEIQYNDELISKEELERRGGITGDKDDYFILFLKEFHKGNFHYSHAKNLIDLAMYIANKKELYIEIHHAFRLMKISSITGKLRQLNRQAKKAIEEEKKAKEEYKNKYKYKK